MVRIRQIKDRRITWGFSLIELLIVIILIGLLSVIGFGYYQTYLMKGRDSQRKSDLQQVRSGLEMFRADQNTYPPIAGTYQIKACDMISPPICSVVTACTWGSLWSCGGSVYMQKLPKDPKSPTNEYHYFISGSTYYLEACLEYASDSDQNSIDVSASQTYTSGCSTKVYQLTNP